MPHANVAHSSGFYPSGKSNVPRRLTPAERRRIEAIVESLIDLLDENDGAPDLEPSLGWSRTYYQGLRRPGAPVYGL